MKRVVLAEIRKLRYQRSTYGMLAGGALFAAINPISLIATSQLPTQGMFLDLRSEATMQQVMTSASSGYLFALIVGIVMSTSEFRHSTAVATYLAEPVRRRVMVSKMLVALVTGALFQTVTTIVGFLAANTYVLRYEHASVPGDLYVRIMAGSVLIGAVLGVVGVAVGSLIRGQLLAVLGAVLWLQIVEGLLLVFADWIAKWSISGAITSVLGVAMRGPDVGYSAEDMLGPWQSVVLLLGYAVVFGAVATATTMRRDID